LVGTAAKLDFKDVPSAVLKRLDLHGVDGSRLQQDGFGGESDKTQRAREQDGERWPRVQ
jgi:hypothetical protein